MTRELWHLSKLTIIGGSKFNVHQAYKSKLISGSNLLDLDSNRKFGRFSSYRSASVVSIWKFVDKCIFIESINSALIVINTFLSWKFQMWHSFGRKTFQGRFSFSSMSFLIVRSVGRWSGNSPRKPADGPVFTVAKDIIRASVTFFLSIPGHSVFRTHACSTSFVHR